MARSTSAITGHLEGVVLLFLIALVSILSVAYLSGYSPSGMGSAEGVATSQFCIVYVIKMGPIPNVALDVGDSFNYEVNITNRNNATPVFSDDTALFDINSSTGVINYTAQQSDIGYHIVTVTVSVFNVCPGFSSDYSWSTSFSMNVTGNVTPPAPPRPRPGGGGSAGAGVRDAVVVQPVVPPPLPDEKPQPKQEFLEQRQTRLINQPIGMDRPASSPVYEWAYKPVKFIKTEAGGILVPVILVLLILLVFVYVVFRVSALGKKKRTKGGSRSKRKKK